MTASLNVNYEMFFSNISIQRETFSHIHHTKTSLANLLQIALPVTGQWVTDYESINPISGRGVVFHSDFGCLEGGVANTPPPPNVYFRPRH